MLTVGRRISERTAGRRGAETRRPEPCGYRALPPGKSDHAVAFTAMIEPTLADVFQCIDDLKQIVGGLTREQRATNEIVSVLLAHIGSGTHLSVEDTAHVLSRLKRKPISIRAVRGMIDRKELTLEQIPGTHAYGIPIAQIHSPWTDVRALRTARRRGREEGTRP